MRTILFFISIFSSSITYAMNLCQNVALGFTSTFPSEINLTNKDIGDIVLTYRYTGTGTCSEDVKYLLFHPPGTTLINNSTITHFEDIYDNTRYFVQRNGAANGYAPGVDHINDQGRGNIGSSLFNPINIVINKKLPVGLTLLNMENWKPFNMVTTEGKSGASVPYGWKPKPQMATIIGWKNEPIRIINRAICRIAVEDSIDFGNVMMPDIISGKVLEKITNVAINCDNVPLKYTMKLSSTTNTPTTNPSRGILGSTNNETIGYQLTWGDSQVGSANTPIILESAHISNAPELNQTIPIKIKPVALSSATMKGGPADTSLRITVRID